MGEVFDSFDHRRGVGQLFRVIHVGLQERALRDVNAAGFPDVRAPHLLVLFVLSSGAQRPSEVARGARMSRQALAYCLDQMEERGYVARGCSSDGDGFATVTITDRGIEAAEVAIQAGYEFERRSREVVGTAQFEAFRTTLRQMAEELIGEKAVRRTSVELTSLEIAGDDSDDREDD